MKPDVILTGLALLPISSTFAQRIPLEKKWLDSSPPPPLPAGVHLITETVQPWIRPGDLNFWTRWHTLLLSKDGEKIRVFFFFLQTYQVNNFFLNFALQCIMQNGTLVTLCYRY